MMTIADKVRRGKQDFDAVHEAGRQKGLDTGGYTEGFEAGKQKEYDAFWDAYQDEGNRANYQYSFCAMGWNDNTFKPKYDLILGRGYTGTFMFWDCYVTDLAATLEKQGIKLDTTLCGYMEKMFQNAKTKRVPELNCSHAMDYNTNGLQLTFTNSQVETIDKLIVSEGLKYVATFQGCTYLKSIVFEGFIGQDINFQWSTLLSRASIESIITHLSSNVSGKTLTLSKTAVDNAFSCLFEDPETGEWVNVGCGGNGEWLELEASKPNWEIVLV